MLPIYQPGDYVLVVKMLFRLPAIGDILVIKHPKFGTLIKQVKIIKASGLIMQSINQIGISQDDIGLVRSDQIIGRVLYKFSSKSKKIIKK